MELHHQEGSLPSDNVYQASTGSIGDVTLTETQQPDAVHEGLIRPSKEKRWTENEEPNAPNPNIRTHGKATKKPLMNLLHNWWLEILSLVVVFAALLAITFTLSTHQNRPLPEWPYKISVNTLVAVYVVVLKGAMVLIITEGLSQMKWTWYSRSRPLQELSKFDNASRGPWGAMLLIWTLRARHIVASIGAIMLVVTLAVDPVSQLLIRYYNCSIQLPAHQSQASIPRRNAFSEMGLHSGAGLSTLTFEFQTAINAGLFNPVSVDISFACPTGNCTFDPYHTVAYCSKCTDISSSLTTSWDVIGSYNETTINGSSSYNTSYPLTRFMTSLPDGFSSFDEEASGGILEYLKFNTSTDEYAVQMIASNLTHPYQLSGNNCTTPAENATWSCMGSGAASCSLYPCIRTYSATVNESKLQETLISTSAEFAYDGVHWASNSVNVACLTPEIRQGLINTGYNITSTTEWIGYWGPGIPGNTTSPDPTPQPSVPNITVPVECQYLMYAPTQMSMGVFMISFFNGSVTADPGGYAYVTNGPVQLNRFFNVARMSFASVESIFANISDSMTAYIRQSTASPHTGIDILDNPVTTSAPGHVFQTQTCIQVRWGYITFPLALVLLTMGFLVAVIVETARQHEADAWKSSALALLFHGLDPETRELHGKEGGEMASVKEMEKAAKGMRVRLRRGDAGWVFEGQ